MQWLRRVPPFEPDERGFKLTAHRGHIGLCLLARDADDQREHIAKLGDLIPQIREFAQMPEVLRSEIGASFTQSGAEAFGIGGMKQDAAAVLSVITFDFLLPQCFPSRFGEAPIVIKARIYRHFFEHGP